MKTNITILITLLTISWELCVAQVTDSDMGVLESTHLPGFVKERKPDVESPYGRSYYLNNSWQLGTIRLNNNQEINNVFFKYDIIKHILEIKDNKSMYLVSAKNVESFNWVDINNANLVQFDPVDAYYNEPEALFGFFEVMDQYKVGFDEYKLLVYHSVWLYPATSSVSLSGSHKSNEIFWKEDYYLAENGELEKLEKKRKDNLYLFKEHEYEMKRHFRKNGLYFRNREDLSAIFNYYMSLVVDPSN